MYCYKCQATKDLSLKKQHHGIMTFICRPCRRTAQKRWTLGIKARESYTDIDPEQWAQKARESRIRIAEHYR